MIRFCENKIIKLGNSCLMFFCFAASGGWQEPENPHTQRVSRVIRERMKQAKLERKTEDLAFYQ